MKTFLASLFCGLMFACAWSPSASPSIAAVMTDDALREEYRQQIVASTAQVIGDDGSSGSAVAVGQRHGGTLYLTAAHIARPGRALTIDGVEAEIIAGSDTADVTVLWVKGTRTARSALAPSGDYFLHRVVACGYPLGVLYVTEGRAMRPVGNGLAISAPLFFGNSGGGVFVKVGQTWRVLGIARGIARAGMNHAAHMGYISDLEMTRDLLEIAEGVLDLREVK